MKKALVLGATGNMGSAIVYELVDRGIEVKAFARSTDKLEKLFGTFPVELVSGDVFQLEDLERAVEDVDVVFHAIGIPYPEWADKHPMLLANILKVVKKKSIKLAMVDNIYAYGRSRGAESDRGNRKKSTYKKG